MRITKALAAGVRAFKGIIFSPLYNEGLSYGWERYYAAFQGMWDAFWVTLRDWGSTTFAALVAACATNAVAGRAMRLIIDAASDVPLLAYRDGPDGEPVEVEGSKALQAIERAGWQRLASPSVWGLYCGGEVFYHRAAPRTGPNAGTPRIIRTLPNARFIRIEYHDNGEPKEYVFTKRGGGEERYPAEEVFHLRLENPANPDGTLPILISARRALTLVEEADTWNRSVARGGGRVPGFLIPEGLNPGQTLTTDQVRDAQKASDNATLERKHANLPQVMSGAFKYQDGSVSPREADWLKGRQVATREIAAVMGVPATLLADEKGGSLTDAGVDSEVRALLVLTVRPLVNMILRELSAWLCPPGERIEADWDQVPALTEDIDAKFERYKGVEVLTEKERRVALGYDADVPDDMKDEEEPEEEQPLNIGGDGQAGAIPEPTPIKSLAALHEGAFDHILSLAGAN